MRSRAPVRLALVAAALFALGGVVQAKETAPEPDATIKLVSKSVAAGVGVSWGSGEIRFKGETHALDVDGLTVGSVGANSITAVGEVYHLTKLDDLDGRYTAVTGDVTLGGGSGGLFMRNQNGVEIHMSATTQGVSLTAGVSGVKVALKK